MGLSLLDSMEKNPDYSVYVFIGFITIPINRDELIEVLEIRKSMHGTEETDSLYFEVDHRDGVILLYDRSEGDNRPSREISKD